MAVKGEGCLPTGDLAEPRQEGSPRGLVGNRGYSQALVQALGPLTSPGLTLSPSFLFCLSLPCGLVLVLCAPVAVGVSAPALSPSGWRPHVEGGCLQSHHVTHSWGGVGGKEWWDSQAGPQCPPRHSLLEGLSGTCPVWMREGQIQKQGLCKEEKLS